MKTRYAIYCVLIALTAFSTPISAEYDIVGDVNADGMITMVDSLFALRMAAGSAAPEMERADVNADGSVNSLDALMIRTIAQKTQVCVNSPEVVSGTFDVAIDICNAVNLDSGQFNLSFDPGVVNVTAVHDGDISGRQVPVESWGFVDADTIRVLFNLPGVSGVSGQGQITTISFETTGSQGDTSVLDISNGELFDIEANEISALWNDREVTVGVPVTVTAPEVASITSGAFDVTIEIGTVIDMNCGQFDLSFNSSVVNVRGVDAGNIADTTVPIVGWRFMDAGTIRVIFKLSDDDCVSGSGYVTRIDFEITGSQGDVSILDISNGKLVDTGADEIPAVWIGAEMAIGVPVTVSAPEVVTDTFEVTIDIENVTDLDSGQFELSFDSGVVNVIDVSAGNIDGTTVPVDCWSFANADTIMVTFNLPGVRGVSGSGYVARIDFAITGSQGDNSFLDMSDGLLVDRNADRIPAIWTDAKILIGEPTSQPPTQAQVHNINTGENFSSIQAAIDDSDTLDGDIIEVGDGVYYENVKVTRSLTIRSLNGSAKCVVQAAKSTDAVFYVTADHVKIRGFTVKGAAGWHKAGICINASYCNVSGNNCSSNYYGISIAGSNNTIFNNDCSSNNENGMYSPYSSNTTLSNNNCSSNNGYGIRLRDSSDNTVSNNILSNNNIGGIDIWGGNNAISNNTCHSNNLDGIYIVGNENSMSNNTCHSNGNNGISIHHGITNTISNNTCSKNGNGLHLSDSANNVISGNIISSNSVNGISFWYSPYNDFHLNIIDSNGCGICMGPSTNFFYLNNFVNNSENICLSPWTGATNIIWNSPQKMDYLYNGSSYTNHLGNYWGDYNGTDADNDGLGDTPWTMGRDKDTHPLMEPFENYHFTPTPGISSCIVYNMDTDEKFSSIQAAINDPDTLGGHIIEVEDGVYRENVRVTKPLTIRSLNGSANCVVQAAKSTDAVFYVTADHVKIRGFTVKGAARWHKAGICINASYCNVSGNNCSDNRIGIVIEMNSSKNVISHNIISLNDWTGIFLGNSNNNSIFSNDISNNGLMLESIVLGGGIFLSGSNNSIINNIFVNDGIYASLPTQCIVRGNTVNGKPLVYLENESGCTITDAGQVILVNCDDIMVRNLDLSHTVAGVQVLGTVNSTIVDNAIQSNNMHGIMIERSSNISINNNSISSNNRHGAYLSFSSLDNKIIDNCINSNSMDGIHLFLSSNNTIRNNNISLNSNDGIYFFFWSENNKISNNTLSSNNRNGIYLCESSNNTIYLNNLINNTDGVRCSATSTNIWNSPSTINYTYDDKTFTNYLGNYWDDYSGTDTDNDGIGESPYYIDSDKDNYPLVMPNENYFVET